MASVAIEGFQREAQMLQDLRHPNIVEMMEVDRDDEGHWYIVLEWLPENLETAIKRDGPCSWEEFWRRFGRQILEAVVYAQKKQIAHRDIKPKNILVSATGVPKLADYGTAKPLDRARRLGAGQRTDVQVRLHKGLHAGATGRPRTCLEPRLLCFRGGRAVVSDGPNLRQGGRAARRSARGRPAGQNPLSLAAKIPFLARGSATR